MLDESAARVVLIGQVKDAARILNSQHLVEGIVCVIGRAAVGISKLREAPSDIVDVMHCTAAVILDLRNPVAGIIRKFYPASVRRRQLGEVVIGVAGKVYGIAHTI